MACLTPETKEKMFGPLLGVASYTDRLLLLPKKKKKLSPNFPSTIANIFPVFIPAYFFFHASGEKQPQNPIKPFPLKLNVCILLCY